MQVSIATLLLQAYLVDVPLRCNQNVNQQNEHTEESHPLPFLRAPSRASAQLVRQR